MKNVDVENGMLLYREKKPDEAYTCEWCGNGIYFGENYYDFDGLIICEECVEKSKKSVKQ